ncbi:GIY-YIG nuclease family protein [Peribacillus frigoritolerans]
MTEVLEISSDNITELQSLFHLTPNLGDKILKQPGKSNSSIYVYRKAQDVCVTLLKGDSYSISFKYRFPTLFRQYARWNASKKIAQYDDAHIKKYGEIQITPAKAGLYVLYDRDGIIIYVGIAENLNERLYNHINSSDFRDHIYLIDTYLIENEFDRENLEGCIINTLFPIFNKDKALYPSMSNQYLEGNPYSYTNCNLTSLEESAQCRKITTIDNLLMSLWNTGVPVGSEYNWIKDQRENWIKEIATKFNITNDDVLQDALIFTRHANEVGEEDICDENLKKNIFSSSCWLEKFY